MYQRRKVREVRVLCPGMGLSTKRGLDKFLKFLVNLMEGRQFICRFCKQQPCSMKDRVRLEYLLVKFDIFGSHIDILA